MSPQFDRARKLIGNSPVMQFAKKAASIRGRSLTGSSSPTAAGAGYGQEFGIPPNVAHRRNVEKQSLYFNMMKFQFNQRGI